MALQWLIRWDFFLDQLDQPESLRGFQVVSVKKGTLKHLEIFNHVGFAYRIGSMYSWANYYNS